MKTLSLKRLEHLLVAAHQNRVLVVGDVILDQFIRGKVSRISPEAPVPVIEFDHENFMPGGAANVARNLTTLGVPTELLGVIGRDDAGRRLKALLTENRVGCDGLLVRPQRLTSVKTRIIAHRQQVVRIDRESRAEINETTSRRLLKAVEARIEGVSALIVGDYGKGVVTQQLLEALKPLCRERGIWLSIDPKRCTSLISPAPHS